MYVKRVFCDNQKELKPIEKMILEPKWEDVKNLIMEMDGEHITEITLDGGNEDDYLCIGGGNDGQYIVYISKNDNAEIYTLCNPNPSKNEEHELVAGGQISVYESEICVTIKDVLIVAEHYYKNGIPSTDYKWC